MEAIAKAKYLKGSPRKARLVIDLVRGKNVSHALAILKFTNKRAADPIAKCIRSAVANATYKAEQENIAIDPDDLWIKSCFVDIGPTKNRRRLRPAPQGRAFFERRHFCHITIELTSEAPEVKEGPVKAKSGGKKKAAAMPAKGAAKAETSDKAKKAEKAEEPAAEAKAEKKAAKPKAEKKPAAKKPADEAPAEEKKAEAPAEKKEAKTEAPAANEEKKSKDAADKKEASSEEE